MIVRVDIEITNSEGLSLAGTAYRFGYQREEPRKRWSSQELKEATRYAVQGLVKEELEKRL
jgi:hypothetical protein